MVESLINSPGITGSYTHTKQHVQDIRPAIVLYTPLYCDSWNDRRLQPSN